MAFMVGSFLLLFGILLSIFVIKNSVHKQLEEERVYLQITFSVIEANHGNIKAETQRLEL